MKGYFEGNCFQLDKGRRVTLRYFSIVVLTVGFGILFAHFSTGECISTIKGFLLKNVGCPTKYNQRRREIKWYWEDTQSHTLSHTYRTFILPRVRARFVQSLPDDLGSSYADVILHWLSTNVNTKNVYGWIASNTIQILTIMSI